ncbi:MAG: methyl-accepting chemotaxis protein [Pseudomonadota bacterium]
MSVKLMPSLMRMNIAKKLPVLFVLLALLATVSMSTVSYLTARDALLERASIKLETDVAGRAEVLALALEAVQADVFTMSRSPAVVDAMQDFTTSWNALVGDPRTVLQTAYVTRNPNPVGEKHRLDDAGDGTSYDAAHARYHGYFRDVMETNGYYDIFLVNAEGELVYSVFKEADFATNLLSGQWANTDLAEAHRAAMRSGPDARAHFFDYKPYAPSADAPASFMSMAVADSAGNTVGSLIVQMPPERLSAALRQAEGLGQSEEITLVGSDGLMRSDSRFTDVNDMLRTRVDTDGVKAALAGESGVKIEESWHGGEVLKAYRPFEFNGTTWAVVTEESLSDVFAESNAILTDTLINTLIAMVVIGVIGFFLARSITQPLTGIADAVKDLADNKFDETPPGLTRSDEIGAIAGNLDQLRVSLADNAAKQSEILFKSTAFDASSAQLMMIDRDFVVTEISGAMHELLKEQTALFRTIWPTFSPDSIVGTCIDTFHKNPAHQRQMLSNPDTMPMTTEINVGEMQFELNIAAIRDADGTYLGNVLEWVDVTEVRKNSGILNAISTHQCLGEFDVQGTFTSVNDRFADVMGMGVADMVGRRFSDFAGQSKTTGQTQAEMWRTLASGEFVTRKIELQASDGSSRVVNASFNGIPNAKGEIHKVVMIGTDVTDLERVAAERRQTLDALSEVQATIEFEPDGTILTANDNFCTAMGYGLEEIQGQHHAMFIDKEERDSADYPTFWSRLASGESRIGIFKRIRKDGAPIYIQATYNPVKGRDGTVIRIVKLACDVTESEVKRLHDAQVLADQEAAQSSVVEAVSSGLSALAAGELTVELNESFAEEYEQLRHDFNAASRKLHTAMQDVVQKAHGISGGAKQISQGADDLATRTERQAGSLEETAAAIEEMTASVESATERAETAENVTKGARKTAEAGEVVVSDTIEAMGEIDRSAEKISEIIGVIDDIAFQTNLLALNAGVEAARAGEAGRGFAVVASEVRALAQRCSDAAKEIKTLISESGDHVKRGVDLVGRTGSELKKINQAVVEISDLVSAIFTSSKEQSLGLADINAAVAQLDQVTQQNAAMVEESTAASHELTTEALELAALVGKFHLETDALETAMTQRDTGPAATLPVEPAKPAARALPTAGATALQPSEDDWEDF